MFSSATAIGQTASSSHRGDRRAHYVPNGLDQYSAKVQRHGRITGDQRERPGTSVLRVTWAEQGKRGSDMFLRITRLGFESLGPEAGSSLPTDECGDSEDKQDHADGQPWPRAPFIVALLPAGHSGADGSGSGPVQIGHVEQRDAEAGYQAGQSAGRGLSPDQQHRCEHR